MQDFHIISVRVSWASKNNFELNGIYVVKFDKVKSFILNYFKNSIGYRTIFPISARLGSPGVREQTMNALSLFSLTQNM